MDALHKLVKLRSAAVAVLRTILVLLTGAVHCRFARSSLFRFQSRAGPGRAQSHTRLHVRAGRGPAHPRASRSSNTSSARAPTEYHPNHRSLPNHAMARDRNRDRIRAHARATARVALDADRSRHFGVRFGLAVKNGL